jgi:RimJ/RimL family protein N-acetyltransferase
MDVVIRENCADLRLGGVDPQNELGFAGFALYAETLRALHESGATRVSAKISAANTRVVNILSSLGFSFSDPEAVFHWHSWDHPPVTRTET